jgi:hypothetical protein
MTLRITCGGCGASLNVDEKHLGKKGKCPKCGEPVQISAPTEVQRTRKRRVATDRQKAFATDLGIHFEDNISSREISKLIDAALAREEALERGEIEQHLKTLAKAKPNEMVAELERRGISAFMFCWDDEERRHSDTFSMSIEFTDNMPVEKVYHMIIRQTMNLCIQHQTLNLSQLLSLYDVE